MAHLEQSIHYQVFIMKALSESLLRIEAGFQDLAPELQRCARWAAEHPREVGLMSMRQQAKRAGATPTSMVRMARALGYADYTAFRQPFQDALGSPVPAFRDRAQSLQRSSASTAPPTLDTALEEGQLANVRSATALNSDGAVQTAVSAILGARRVAFLGVRSCFAISHHFCYAYGLMATNGVLVHGLGGSFPDQIDTLTPDDLLVCITQQPYGRPTIEALQVCHARGAPVLTLTDSTLSPAAAYSTYLLRFDAHSPSYFHSMLGSMALVEKLLDRIAREGGQSVLERLTEAEQRLQASNAYWVPPTGRGRKKST